MKKKITKYEACKRESWDEYDGKWEVVKIATNLDEENEVIAIFLGDKSKKDAQVFLAIKLQEK